MKNLNFLIVKIILFSVVASAQIDRVEPPFWWSDMAHSELEILFYGKNISRNEVSVSGGITIKKIQKVENPNYLFVTIDTKNIPAQDFVFTFKNGKKSFTQKYSLKNRRKSSAQRKGFDSSDVIYLIMPDRFANGNPKNDSHPDVIEKADRNLPAGRHGGDIEGIIKNLDYIHELGATTIWNTPLLKDNEKAYSYHGYATSDLYKIDPRYGTNEDFVWLADELHNRDMKLIMDYVPNHWGLQHWLIQDLPSKDWINHWETGENGFRRSSYRQTSQFDPNASEYDQEHCMDGWFDTTMPDMDLRNPLVLNYTIQNAIWWIEYAGLDGFRVDTFSYNDKNVIAEWTKKVMEEYPDFNIVGEIWMHDQAQIAYWQKNSKIGALQNYNSHLPSVMDFTLHNAVSVAFNESEQHWDKGMTRIYENFVNDFLYPDIDNIMVFLGNHDTSRFNTIVNSDIKKYKLAMSLLLTIRGIPQIYYGDEIGMIGDKSKGDADIRRDFPGGWQDDTQNAFIESGRTETQNEYFDFTKKLLNWRKNKSVIHYGKTTHYVPENNVYVYFRYNDDEVVMIILNNSDNTQTFKTNRFAKNIGNYTTGIDNINKASIDITKEISIDPKSCLILELDTKMYRFE